MFAGSNHCATTGPEKRFISTVIVAVCGKYTTASVPSVVAEAVT